MRRTCRPCSRGSQAHAMSQSDFPGRTRASKERSNSEGPPEPHGTRRTPGRQEGCGCASACDRLWRARDGRAPPHLRRPPAHENTHDRLSTPRAEYTILGAWGRAERVTNEAPARTCRVTGVDPHRAAPGSRDRRAAGPPGWSLAARPSHVLLAGPPTAANHLARCSKRPRKWLACKESMVTRPPSALYGVASVRGNGESRVPKLIMLTPTGLTSPAPPGAVNHRPWALPVARRDASGAPQCAAEHAGKATSPVFLAVTSLALHWCPFESQSQDGLGNYQTMTALSVPPPLLV